jgi:HK97 family phage major capsid protein
MTTPNGAIPEISAETQKLLADFPNAWDQLQKSLDAKNTDTVKNIETKFAEIQDGLTKYQTALEMKKKEDEARENRIKDLEAAMAKGGGSSHEGKAASRTDAEYKSFMDWVKKGDDGDFDTKTLRTDVNTQGGYLLPEVIDAEIRKNITETSPIRLYARVRPASGKSVKITRRGSLANSTGAPFEGELEESDTGNSNYIEETVTLFRQAWTVQVTRDQLIMSAHDVEQEIMTDVMEMFAIGEGRNNLLGTGHKGPKGIITDSRIEVVTSNTTNLIDFTDLAEVTGQLKRGYNPMWFFNRKTFAELVKYKGSDGHPIWMPVPAGGALPPTLLGFPYSSEMIHMDDYTGAAAGQKPIMFGDMGRCYEIFDLAGVHVIRDDYTGKKKAQVEFTFDRYLSGQVILPEAMKILKTKA